MSGEAETTVLSLGYKETSTAPSNINPKNDEAQPTPTSVPAQTQTKPAIVTVPSIQPQPSPSGQANIVTVLPSNPVLKSEPVSLHPAPLPIQPAPLAQHGIQQVPQSQQHTSLRTHAIPVTTTPQTTPTGKPPVGSEEWHRQRRENHKEVERRRRDTINAGINELAKIVPGCEKNKGSILNRAVQYIQQLKENEATNIEKWTLEKLLTDQAIQELQTQVEVLKSENGRLRAELEELQGPTKKKQRTD
ncbi:26178_t:CDS:2 [Dentiscutata erythropus]|uniref:26178_t:CDS:1 n=1 Tax=Dentiscutata erythropus TaxID=1348616 RepID=A0A9N9J5A7_9GLOM|nr:26178_t:CDS:2 [Dentiscutata erythropus]